MRLGGGPEVKAAAQMAGVSVADCPAAYTTAAAFLPLRMRVFLLVWLCAYRPRLPLPTICIRTKTKLKVEGKRAGGGGGGKKGGSGGGGKKGGGGGKGGRGGKRGGKGGGRGGRR